MSTFPKSFLSEPIGTAKIPESTLIYFRMRLKQRIFSLIAKEFKRSGLSQADLGRRLDKDPGQISRLLSGPGNLTIDTASDVLFALGGGEPAMTMAYPLAKGAQITESIVNVPEAAPLPSAPPASSTAPSEDFIEQFHKQKSAPIPFRRAA